MHHRIQCGFLLWLVCLTGHLIAALLNRSSAVNVLIVNTAALWARFLMEQIDGQRTTIEDARCTNALDDYPLLLLPAGQHSFNLGLSSCLHPSSSSATFQCSGP
ncbi:hypothetical protein [Porticoccus hydrocarbonoclasticus]|uniref:hypothetical protein n=1 Tax=Porticoccus hydrocarbonoclasticus TaxID=1073414 RepID=UPI00235492BC|nr:hypothetical protein [Porticoccus hydrocarbonoclasticus]